MKPLRQKIDSCYAKIKAVEEELRILRKFCAHENTKVGMHAWRVGAYAPMKYCADCDEILGPPSQEEREACWKESGFADSVKSSGSTVTVEFGNIPRIDGGT